MKQLELEYKFCISTVQATNFCKHLSTICQTSNYLQKIDDYYRKEQGEKHKSAHLQPDTPLDIRLRTSTVYANCIFDHDLTDNFINNKEEGAKPIQTSVLTYKIRQRSLFGRKEEIKREESTRQDGVIQYRDNGGEAEFYQEFESKIEDSEVIKTLLGFMGARHYVRKEKKGWLYTLAIDNALLMEIDKLDITDSISKHISVEIMEVSSLGWFLEIEALLPCSASYSALPSMLNKYLVEVLETLSLDIQFRESRPYIQMIKEQEDKASGQ